MTSVLPSSSSPASGLPQSALLKQGGDGGAPQPQYSQLAYQQQRQQGGALDSSASSSAVAGSPHRPTSAPPDLDLSSTNVFAFGLRSFQHFRHESAAPHTRHPRGTAAPPPPHPRTAECRADCLSRLRVCVSAEASGGNGGSGSADGGQLSAPGRQVLVDDAQPNLWPSAASSPSSTRHLSSQAQAQSSFLASQSSHSSHPPSQSAHFLGRTPGETDDDIAQLQLQQAVDALSLQDGLSHRHPAGAVGSHMHAQALASAHGSGSSTAAGAPLYGNGADAVAPSSDDVSSAYLYNLNLQQSLLSSLNLSALSPGQLQLLQQQMQRLNAAPPPMDEQQKQLQQLQHQQQLLMQQHRMHMQAGAYQRGLYTQQQQLLQGGQRGYRGGGVPDERGMRGGGMNGDRTSTGRRGRDGDRQHFPRSQGKFGNGGGGKPYRGGGYGYGQQQEYGANAHGEDKALLSPHRPLSPAGASHYGPAGTTEESFTSSLVAQFSSASTLEELTGHIYLIAKDQYGCRLLQRMLDERTPPGLVDAVFGEVYEHINELMTDAFGNYLIQKLLEQCHESQRLAIISRTSPDLVAIALNMHGTRAVQKIVETVGSVKEVEVVVAALRSSVVTLIKDLNGNHVIQRCLHHLSSADNQFIFDAVSRHCVSVSTHKHGCCVLQRCIDYATPPQRRQIVQEVVNNALELMTDAFGNYIVQYVLDLGEQQVSAGIIANLLGHVSSLSVQKFSSNVVEKCLELASDKLRARMIDELMSAERLPRLLSDPYANYVLQKALTVCKRQQFERLVAAIKPHLAQLRHTSFGKRIQHKIVRKFPHLGQALDQDDLEAAQPQPLYSGPQQGQGQRSGYAHGGGLGGGAALPGYGALSPNSAFHHSLQQQQQHALTQTAGTLSFNSAGGLQGVSGGSFNGLSELDRQSRPHSSLSFHSAPPGLPQPMGSGAAAQPLLPGMPQLLAYPPATSHSSNAGGQVKQLHHRGPAGGLAIGQHSAFSRQII